MARKKRRDSGNVVARNRKARHDYSVEETVEAGIVLSGTEVKSLRLGRASIGEAYAGEKDGELFLLNAHVPEYAAASRFNHEPRRPRKLLLRKRQLAKLIAAQQRQGMALVPLSLYFNPKGVAKIELALARGRQRHDKRQATKDHDWKRQKARLMREK